MSPYDSREVFGVCSDDKFLVQRQLFARHPEKIRSTSRQRGEGIFDALAVFTNKDSVAGGIVREHGSGRGIYAWSLPMNSQGALRESSPPRKRTPYVTCVANTPHSVSAQTTGLREAVVRTASAR